jgi:uncharacterized protein (TIGR00251 family)
MARLRIYCQPGAKRTEWAGWHDGNPKLKLHAPAVEGSANRELLRFIADTFEGPVSQIQIQSGEHSRIKTLEINFMSDQQINQLIQKAIGAKP